VCLRGCASPWGSNGPPGRGSGKTMTRYIVQRLVQAVGVVLLVSVFVFALVRLIPGDPVSIMLGENLSPEVERELIRKWGLDRPIFEQYVAWLANLVRGDLGQSIRTQESVGQ